MTRAPLARIQVRDDSDVAIARMKLRTLARQEDAPETVVEAIATALTELGRNIVEHARFGELTIEIARSGVRPAIVVVARDRGPGIADVEQAMQDGYSSKNGLGFGLPGARRMVDEFELSSMPGQGTTVKVTKWIR